MRNELFPVQFLSSGLAQRGKDDEEFDGFLIKDIKKEISRAKRLGSDLDEILNMPLSLDLTYDRVGVALVIRTTQAYSLEKIKPIESEKKYRCCLRYNFVAYNLVKTGLLEW